MDKFKTILPQELLKYYNPINETILVIANGKHVTKENLEEIPVDVVLEKGFQLHEQGLIILDEPGVQSEDENS